MDFDEETVRNLLVLIEKHDKNLVTDFKTDFKQLKADVREHVIKCPPLFAAVKQYR